MGVEYLIGGSVYIHSLLLPRQQRGAHSQPALDYVQIVNK